MDWIQFLNSGIKIEEDRKFGYKEPASESMLIDLKKQLNLTQLPSELEELYRQTDGVDDILYIKKTDENIVMGAFIWSIERVLETNLHNRTSSYYKEIYKSFDNLFFFADAGNGDQFAFKTGNGQFERADIYVWDHEDDSREWIAPNLKAFIEGWFTGSI